MPTVVAPTDRLSHVLMTGLLKSGACSGASEPSATRPQAIGPVGAQAQATRAACIGAPGGGGKKKKDANRCVPAWKTCIGQTAGCATVFVAFFKAFARAIYAFFYEIFLWIYFVFVQIGKCFSNTTAFCRGGDKDSGGDGTSKKQSTGAALLWKTSTPDTMAMTPLVVVRQP